MVETVNAADAVEALDKWAREQERVLSLQEMEYVGAFRRIFKGSNHLTPVGMMLVWSQATRSVAETIPGLMLPIESQFATFARMASAVFPADFAAEATRLVRNEPKRASDAVLERIGDALECIAVLERVADALELLACAVHCRNVWGTEQDDFYEAHAESINRVIANVEGRK
jgi:hypothetical protein